MKALLTALLITASTTATAIEGYTAEGCRSWGVILTNIFEVRQSGATFSDTMRVFHATEDGKEGVERMVRIAYAVPEDATALEVYDMFVPICMKAVDE